MGRLKNSFLQLGMVSGFADLSKTGKTFNGEKRHAKT
jgi:hypothetical protein